MKKGILLLISLIFFEAQAAPICATNKAELANIKPLTKKVNLFGTWTGILDNAPISAKLYLNAKDLKLRGLLNYDGSEYGPVNLKFCMENDQYFFEAYGTKVEFEVLSRTKIKSYSPFDANEVVIMNKK